VRGVPVHGRVDVVAEVFEAGGGVAGGVAQAEQGEVARLGGAEVELVVLAGGQIEAVEGGDVLLARADVLDVVGPREGGLAAGVDAGLTLRHSSQYCLQSA
jgi:hypothetical protein